MIDITVRAAGVTFGYRADPVIQGLTLEIPHGQFVAILGPNGSGKSTLLRLMARVLGPHGGGIWIGPRPLQSLRRKELARIVSLLPQEVASGFAYQAEDVVMMGRTPHLRLLQREAPTDYEVVRQAMVATDTWQFRESALDELSGGERQRVMIARALAQEPSVLLLDEPTAHLDIHHQVEIFDLLAELRQSRSMTVIAALHDINIAAQYCDSLIFLNQGRIGAAGAPADVVTHEVLHRIYGEGLSVDVVSHPTTGRPMVLPTPGLNAARPRA